MAGSKVPTVTGVERVIHRAMPSTRVHLAHGFIRYYEAAARVSFCSVLELASMFPCPIVVAHSTRLDARIVKYFIAISTLLNKIWPPYLPSPCNDPRVRVSDYAYLEFSGP